LRTFRTAGMSSECGTGLLPYLQKGLRIAGVRMTMPRKVHCRLTFEGYGWCARYENALAVRTVVSFPSIPIAWQVRTASTKGVSSSLAGMVTWGPCQRGQLSTMDMAPLFWPDERIVCILPPAFPDGSVLGSQVFHRFTPDWGI